VWKNLNTQRTHLLDWESGMPPFPVSGFHLGSFQKGFAFWVCRDFGRDFHKNSPVSNIKRQMVNMGNKNKTKSNKNTRSVMEEAPLIILQNTPMSLFFALIYESLNFIIC